MTKPLTILSRRLPALNRALTISALLIGAALTPALATGSNPYLGVPSIRSYNLTQVLNAPGLIDVVQGDFISITFPEKIDSFVLAHQEAFSVQLDGDTAYVSALNGSGLSTLLVKLDSGMRPRFVLNATKTGQLGKGVVVLDDRAAGNYSKSVPLVLNSGPAAQGLAASAPLTGVAPTSAPSTDAGTAALSAALTRLKTYAQKTVTASVVAHPDTREVEVTLTNTGAVPVALIGSDVRLFVDETPYAVSAPNVTLAAGTSQKVLLRLSQDVTAEQGLRLTWEASDGVHRTLVEASQ